MCEELLPVTQCHIPEDLELQCEFSSICMLMFLAVNTCILFCVNPLQHNASCETG